MQRRSSDKTRRHQAWECAYRYFKNDETHDEIARELRITRATVVKRIKQALRDEYFRVIIVRHPGYSDTEGQLARNYGLQEVRLVPSVTAGFAITARLLGEAAASLVMVIVAKPGTGSGTPRQMRIGVAGGLTIHETIQAMDPEISVSAHLKIYPLVYGPIPDNVTSAGANAGLMASRWGPKRAQSMDLWKFHFPKGGNRDLIGITKQTKILSEVHQIDLALVGIGALVPDSTLDRNLKSMGHRLDEVNEKGGVGDICSSLLDADGNVLNWPPNLNRITAITPEQLRSVHRHRKTPKPVIAVAGGMEKIDAIAAVLRGGGTGDKPKPYVSHLVTDKDVAEALLSR